MNIQLRGDPRQHTRLYAIEKVISLKSLKNKINDSEIDSGIYEDSVNDIGGISSHWGKCWGN